VILLKEGKVARSATVQEFFRPQEKEQFELFYQGSDDLRSRFPNAIFNQEKFALGTMIKIEDRKNLTLILDFLKTKEIPLQSVQICRNESDFLSSANKGELNANS
jgi:hypothetical protein